MSIALTSWKEIGQYLGKGVRTVQRWERESALPIQRPANGSRGSVLAYPEELDTWTRTRMKGPGASLVESLGKEVAAMRAEAEDLRSRVEFLESSLTQPTRWLELQSANMLVLPGALDSEHSNGTSAVQPISQPASPWVGDPRSRFDLVRSKALLVRSQAVRVRIALTMTVLSVGETGAKWGNYGIAESSIRTARHAARKIQSCLELSGRFPDSELPELRSLVAQLESRIENSTLRIADAMPRVVPKKPPQRAIPRALRSSTPSRSNGARRSA